MISGLYFSSTGCIMQDAYRDVVANNLANVSTNGFKKDYMVFTTRDAESIEDGNPRYSNAIWDSIGGGAFLAGSFSSFQSGPLRQTGRDYDVAIEGNNGFFSVSDGIDDYLTRNGNFTIDTGGFLTTYDYKYRVLNDKGKPIQLQRDVPVYISRSGLVTQNQKKVAHLGIFDVPDKDNLVKVGDSNFQYTGNNAMSLVDYGTIGIAQGFLEGSSVNAIEEMVSLIASTRAYETNITMIRNQDQTLARVVSDVGSIPI